jgi:hypothetical protein
MQPIFRFALCPLAFCLLLACPLLAQSAASVSTSASTSSSTQQFADPAAYVASHFGSTFTLEPKIPPMFGDLDGDGNEDLVLVGSSTTPMLSQEQFGYKVQDPYDAYFGTGNTKITSQFTLHFDGSSRCILIVFGWRLPRPKPASKFVLINTPFESASIVNLRLKKKNLQAIEVVDRTTLHALVLWDGRHWRWSAQGMEGDDSFKMPPPN